MECIEARALKSRFLSQTAFKTNSPVCCNDDAWCVAGISGDDFLVEDLLNLDFSDKDLKEGCYIIQDEDEKASVYPSVDCSSVLKAADGLDSLGAGELSFPVEDLENLEWVSQIVDDSASEVSLLCLARGFAVKTESALAPSGRELPKRPVSRAIDSCFTAKVPVKARSKRCRENGRPWSLASPALSSEESSSASASSSHGSNRVSPFVFSHPAPETDWFSAVEKPATKKQRVIKPEADGGLVSGRRCTHCQVQKTPQWRAGPLGPKTLCNACGVRFKSGRLFPEYRPACSPTFSLEIHSNSHRKVLEMRRMKSAEPGSIQPSQS